MAVITPSSRAPLVGGVTTGSRVVTETALTAGTDTFTYQDGDWLHLRNPTGGTVTATVLGDDTDSWPVPGGTPLSAVASGLPIALGAGQECIVPLDTSRAYLQGSGLVNVTGGNGLIAILMRGT